MHLADYLRKTVVNFGEPSSLYREGAISPESLRSRWPSIEDIRTFAAYCREHEVKPLRITTKAMARRMRRDDAKRGLDSKWRIGDYYYWIWYDGRIEGVKTERSAP